MAAADNDPLQAALSTAFEQVPSLKSVTVGVAYASGDTSSGPAVSASPGPTTAAVTASTTAAAAAAAAAGTEESASTPSEEPWKAEYDARLAEWRATAAVARAKSEETRAKWEGIRAAEREEESKQAKQTQQEQSAKKESISAEWENVSTPPTASASFVSVASSTSVSGPAGRGGGAADSKLLSKSASSVRAGGSPSPVDGRDLVSGEGQGGHGLQILESVLGPRPTSSTTKSSAHHGQQPSGSGNDTTDEDSAPVSGSRTWENIPSLASSFPSLPSQQDTQLHRSTPHDPSLHIGSTSLVTELTPASRSATLVMFDPKVPRRTRVIALFASIGINFVLPFINGVMLGFGEIFARGLVDWWRGGRAALSSVGLRTARL